MKVNIDQRHNLLDFKKLQNSLNDLLQKNIIQLLPKQEESESNYKPPWYDLDHYYQQGVI